MQRALFADTDRVRFDAPVSATLAPGRSTAAAVVSGLLLAQAGAVRLALNEAVLRGPEPVLLLCGGGAAELQRTIDTAVVHAPDLVFEGLLIQARAEGEVPADYAADFTPENLP